MSTTKNLLYVEKARGLAQCELFLMKNEAGSWRLLFTTPPG